MFRRNGEKEKLWLALSEEDPWQHSNDGLRLSAWERAAETAAAVGTITVETSAGVHDVNVNLMRGKVLRRVVDRINLLLYK